MKVAQILLNNGAHVNSKAQVLYTFIFREHVAFNVFLSLTLKF